MAVIKYNDGATIEIKAGTTAIPAGSVRIEGTTAVNVTAVVPYEIPANTKGIGNAEGTYIFPCGTATTFTVGAPVYYNKTSELATATNTDYLIGKAFGAVASGDGEVKVKINA